MKTSNPFVRATDPWRLIKAFSVALALAIPGLAHAQSSLTRIAHNSTATPESVGVVSDIKVLTSKTPDVSSLESWKRSVIKEGMSAKEKALAIFNSQIAFQHDDFAPVECLQRDQWNEWVLDPIKMFNVYGYTMCSVSAASMACLARYAGLPARVSTVREHIVPEFYFDGAWHMLDADQIHYFPKADGSIASLPEIVAGISSWLEVHPEFPMNDKAARHQWMKEKDWKVAGPEILSRNPYFNASGWLPVGRFAWADSIQTFSRINPPSRSCYSMGYEVKIQLRPGERLTRNWSNQGLHVNMDGVWLAPRILKPKVAEKELAYTRQWGDVAPGRIGNGVLEYVVPLADGGFRRGALAVENLAARSEDGLAPALHVKNSAGAGLLDIRMPSSYVYLNGLCTLTAVLGDGGEIKVLLSDNNGLDWKPVATVDGGGEQKIDLTPFVSRRYSYIIRFVIKGRGTGLEALKLTHDIQHSQRPLPALERGENTINFAAGAPEGTITIEGAMDVNPKTKGKQLTYSDFHPIMDGFPPGVMPRTNGKPASITFPVTTPGDMTRLRVSDYFISDGKDGMFLIEVSFDDGKTWKIVDQPGEADLGFGPPFHVGRYVAVSEVPAGARSALVRYRGVGVSPVALGNARIDADYAEPHGGFRPTQVTYVWDEDGVEKRDVHVARSPKDTWTIHVGSTPVMKSLVLQLAP